MQAFVQGLIDKKYACSLVLKNEMLSVRCNK
jgi:hypothetical protein